MRTIKIEGCEYPKFQNIRDILYSHIPFGVISNTYSKEMKTAFFVFWDLAYIPDALKEYIMEPPNNPLLEKCNKAMNELKASQIW